LPEGINAETANANFENGVLEVIFDMPKTQQRQGKQIAIGGKR
jgi:HSP20 family molecular chaperone IbpA